MCVAWTRRVSTSFSGPSNSSAFSAHSPLENTRIHTHISCVDIASLSCSTAADEPLCRTISMVWVEYIGDSNEKASARLSFSVRSGSVLGVVYIYIYILRLISHQETHTAQRTASPSARTLRCKLFVMWNPKRCGWLLLCVQNRGGCGLLPRDWLCMGVRKPHFK